jgi:hypothetical protein
MNGKQFRHAAYFLVMCAITFSTAYLTACSQIINKVKLTSITVSPTSPPNLTISYSMGFYATANYSDGSSAAISTQALWSSSDIGVASINSSGNARGVSVGTTKITATFDGITSSPITLNVIMLSYILVNPNTSINLPAGTNEQFTVTGYNWDGSTTDITSQVTWSSSDNAVVTIDSTGSAKAISLGTSVINASFEGITSRNVLINVISLPATIMITPSISP